MSILLNGEPVPVTRFPDNTTQIWKLPEVWLQLDRPIITWQYSYEGELMEIGQLKDLLESYGVKGIILRIDYLPFARQDHPVSNITTFALRTFATLLNALEFEAIYIDDPHSETALTLIKNSSATYPTTMVYKVMNETRSDLIVYPDLGALRKYSKLYTQYHSISGEKTRDKLTGYITSYKLNGECAGRRALIVDDICDGGATFVLLAKELKAQGAKEVNLFVTHGIFSKGVHPLYDAGISRVFTRNGEAVKILPDTVGYRKIGEK